MPKAETPNYLAVQTVAVTASDAGARLDRWFQRHIPELGHGRLQKLLRTAQVKVDGSRATASQRLEAGQTIRIPPLPGLGEKREPKKPAAVTEGKDAADLVARVLYRDEDVIALNKPSGLAVQGGTGTAKHIDGMLDALRFGADARPRLVHRLDRDTSGVLLLARTARAAAFLAKAFQGRNVRKTYWALTRGVPSPRAGTIDVPLAKAEGPMGGERMEESEEGDRAVTDYRVVEDLVRAAWVELMPLTGRTHQLRAHMAAIGTPIVGDRKYGGSEAVLPGIAPKLHLHAAALALRLPSGKQWHVTAPLPEHMRATWKLMGFAEKPQRHGEGRRPARSVRAPRRHSG
ncbi:MAG: RluA family pseudouridine synthase [Alphaproteobacteria bacterium]|nr:RluA family pseudouridine synthase [Alphaproteobacteria bacterium]